LTVLPFFIFIISLFFFYSGNKKKLDQAWSRAQPCWALEPPLVVGEDEEGARERRSVGMSISTLLKVVYGLEDKAWPFVVSSHAFLSTTPTLSLHLVSKCTCVL
jgi:hypothetical protein